jgi:acyl-CoA oxidase
MESIKKARDNIDFDQDELSHIIYQGKQEFEDHKHLVHTFINDPVLHQNYNFYNLSREQTITMGYKRHARLEELGKKGIIEKPHMGTIGTYADLSSAPSAFGLHYAMFECAIRYLASDEQQADLIPKTMNCEINGCYAQTEIGHGSDVSSLETTATFDKATDTFVVNSPTIKSAKFWPGELGKTATHAAFHAQLIIFGKNYGVQTFLCQIRDLDSHSPLKGLEIGDIGNKGGYVQKDNGYMYFHDFVIPRSALLAKYTKVDREGVFSIEGNPKFAYACMLYIRVYLISTASKYTAIALNVALKYGLYRTQFRSLSDTKDERKVADYHSYRAKMAPIVAFTFASLFTKQRILSLYFQMIKDIEEKNDFTLLKEMHMLGS